MATDLSHIDVTSPADASAIAQGAANIRALKADILGFGQTEHDDDGKHTGIRLFSVASYSVDTVLTAANIGELLSISDGVTVTLPRITPAVGAIIPAGRFFVAYKTGAGAAITIAANAADTIQGAASLSISTQGRFTFIFSNGVSAWFCGYMSPV